MMVIVLTEAQSVVKMTAVVDNYVDWGSNQVACSLETIQLICCTQEDHETALKSIR